MDNTGNFFQESLKKIQFPFSLSGFPLHVTDKNILVLRLIFLWNFTCVNSDVLGAIVFLYKGINTVDFVKLTYMAPCVFYSSLADTKALCLLFNEKRIRKLIKKLMDIDGKVKIYNGQELFMKNRDSFHKVISYFNIVYVSCCVAFLISPLFMMALSYYQGKFEIVYPFTIIYPFDPYRIEYFPMVYLHQGWSTVIVLIFVSSADYLFYTCCSYISCHFKLLQRQFESIIQATSGFKKLKYADIQTEFEELVKWHQQLISLTVMLDTIYAKSSLYNFVSSSALICLTLFNVTIINDIAFLLTSLIFLSMCLVQIYLLCYFGGKITQASVEVSDSVYNSLWYLCDVSVGKYMLLVMIRSQKPCKLTALGFADINQRAYMKIMSNAWSYFALLKSIYH